MTESVREKSRLLDRVLGAFRRNGVPALEGKAYPASGVSFTGANWSRIYDLGNAINPDAELLGRATAFATSAYCYTAMVWRGTRVGEPPLMVVQETEAGDEWRPDHPLAELFDAPRPDLSMGEILHVTTGYKDLTGAAAWVIDRDLLGRRRQITPYSGDQVKTEPADGMIFGRFWVLHPNGSWRPVPREDIVYFREANPLSWRTTVSKVDVALAQLNLSHTVGRITRNFLLKAMFPGGILSPDKDWHPTPEEWDMWKQTIELWHGGPANSGAPLALQGNTTFSRTASGMADLLPNAVLDRVEATVGAVFGIPPVVLGWLTGLQNSPWSQMTEARRQTYEDTVEPIWSEMASRIGRTLLTPEERKDGYLVRFDTSRVRALQADQERQARVSQANADIWTVGERRLSTGMSLLGDSRDDEIAGLTSGMPSFDLGQGGPQPDADASVSDAAAIAASPDQSLQSTALNGAQVAALVEIVTAVTAGVLPVSAGIAMVAAAFPLLTADQVTAIFEDVEEGSAIPEQVAAAVGDGKSADTRDLLWFLFHLSTKASEPAWTRIMASHLDALKKKMIAAAELPSKSAVADAQHTRHPRLRIAVVDDVEAKANPPVPAWAQKVIDLDTPALTAKTKVLVTSTGGAGVRRLAARLKVSFNVLEPGLASYAKREAKFLAEVMGQTTGSAVARAVQSSLDRGETIRDLTKRLEELPAFDRDRAKMTARTETTRAWNGAQRTAMSTYRKTAKVKVTKQWLSARDERVRDEHVALDEETAEVGIPVDEEFSNGLMEPGEPNCRCTLIYALGDPEEPDAVIDEPSPVNEEA
jgi:SPP1 gp7 family putative phage head morphogenesis protein